MKLNSRVRGMIIVGEHKVAVLPDLQPKAQIVALDIQILDRRGPPVRIAAVEEQLAPEVILLNVGRRHRVGVAQIALDTHRKVDKRNGNPGGARVVQRQMQVAIDLQRGGVHFQMPGTFHNQIVVDGPAGSNRVLERKAASSEIVVEGEIG